MSDAPIRDWFIAWLREHTGATGWAGWPEGKTDEGRVFFRRFRDAMEAAGFTRDEAAAATNALRGRKDPGRAAYLDAVLEFVAPIRRAERDVENAREKARLKELLARWDAMPEGEKSPIREQVLAVHPYWRTLPGMLRIFCAESLEDATLLEPEAEQPLRVYRPAREDAAPSPSPAPLRAAASR